jgi:hypothetical protein
MGGNWERGRTVSCINRILSVVRILVMIESLDQHSLNLDPHDFLQGGGLACWLYNTRYLNRKAIIFFCFSRHTDAKEPSQADLHGMPALLGPGPGTAIQVLILLMHGSFSTWKNTELR